MYPIPVAPRNEPPVRVSRLDLPKGSATDNFGGKHALIGSASQTIPIIDGELQLGQWQRVFFIELDRARDRKVFVQVLGE